MAKGKCSAINKCNSSINAKHLSMFEILEPQEEVKKMNPVLGSMAETNHEQILFCQDRSTGLKAIIAVHNTILGPSLGGTRMWAYQNEQEALTDVLRLSRGMTYKSAAAGLNLGGGKAVIIGNSKTDKNEILMRRFGKFVESLGGKYITAEDVGTSTSDMVHISMETKHVTGLPESMGGAGDPSPVTAYGVYMGMKAAAKKAYGTDSLEGKTVLVQGVGHVGQFLLHHLALENARLLISDIDEARLKEMAELYNAEVINQKDVYDAKMDIYAPCALGATLNDETISKLKCAVVAGAANNQLQNEVTHAEALQKRGILYAPDFVINAGGIINCYHEVIGYNRDAAMQKTEHIYDTTLRIFDRAHAEKITTARAANQLAEERITGVANIKVFR